MTDRVCLSGVYNEMMLTRENERLRAALESSEAWLERRSVHMGGCEGGFRCICGLSAIRYEVHAALEGKDD